ncbi:uncharacterized protein [Bactrocera oleae]|uniref:uncharacterized protein n=1 Tax=Bactrocera oleae TaxID=104688 RepID=UPI00387E7D0A
MLSKTTFTSLLLCALFINNGIQSVSARPFLQQRFQFIIDTATDSIKNIIDSVHETVKDKASTMVSNIATQVATELLPQKCKDDGNCDQSFLESIISKTAINLITERLKAAPEPITTSESTTDATTTDVPTTDVPATED